MSTSDDVAQRAGDTTGSPAPSAVHAGSGISGSGLTLGELERSRLGELESTEAAAVFDVREFARTARGSHRAELDLAGLEGARLEPDAARLLGVLRDLERSTMQRMRNLLVTATHKDARVTAFLSTWAFEKFWLADALDAVLDTTASQPPVEDGPKRRDRRERAARRGPVRRAVLANFAGADIVGVHVTSGLVDEWITQAAYRRLAAAAEKLGSIAQLALDVKERHLAFLQEDARRRLADSTRVQKLARTELTQQAWPIGSIERPDAERGFFERMVFGGAAGRREAGGIRELIAALPGLAAVAPVVEARLAR
ncbi:MAG: hypothetical protein HY996_00410 [Micrococcales bacterium]|nr:hypothetical protein [Micrococcales bacterium]